MIFKKINLTQDGRVNMKTYIHDVSTEYAGEDWHKQFKQKRPNDQWQMRKRPAIIIMPGGAFTLLSDREGEPVALTFLKEGFNTFVLRYSIGDYSEYPNPVEDISKAIWEVRRNANRWDINPDAICVMGFSAGACVAALIATQWNRDSLADRLKIPVGGNKPNAAVICYGPSKMIETGELPADIECGKILKDQPPQLDIAKYVDEDTPPMFIWHTRHDPFIASEDALILANALYKKGIDYELHVFERGLHGLSVNNDLSDYGAGGELRTVNVGLWPSLCTQWLKEKFLIGDK